MNRELKFRVREGNRILGYVATAHNINGGAWYFVDYSLPEDERILDYCSEDMLPPFRVMKNPMGKLEYDQYTGLKDKNGREIYEGDIVVYDGELGTDKREVRWFVDTCNFNLCRPMNGQTVEVIGNIYENPELLEEDTTEPEQLYRFEYEYNMPGKDDTRIDSTFSTDPEGKDEHDRLSQHFEVIRFERSDIDEDGWGS